MTPGVGLERVVRAAAHRPRRVLALVALLCAAGTALALGLQPSAATSTLAGRSSDTYQATERYRERFGDHAIVVLVRGPLQQLVLTENLGRLLGLEGCLSGNRPEGGTAPGGERGPCAELARTKPVQVVYGPGTFINSAVGEIQDQLTRQLDVKGGEAEKAARAARQIARRQGKSEGRAGAARGLGQAARLRGVRARPAGAQPQVRARRRRDAAARRSRLRRDARLRPLARGDDAEGALRVPVPVIGVGGDPGPAQARPQRCGTGARDRARARGGADARLQAAQRGGLHRDRRARPGRGPLGGARRVDRAAAAGRARRDGGGARARLPAAAAAGAAGGRARRGRADVRADGAGRRAADDGLDRGPARAARARRRLRDPVPGADPRSADGARRGAGGAPARCRRSRRRRSRRPPASSCCCSRRCRWCAGSACCSCSASGWRSRSR